METEQTSRATCTAAPAQCVYVCVGETDRERGVGGGGTGSEEKAGL